VHVTTYFIIAVIIIVVFLLFRSEHKFEFLKAAILFVIQLCCSTINFLIFMVIAYMIMSQWDHVNLGNLFLLLAAFVVLSGVFVYWGMRLASKIFKFSTTTLTLVEYYIQWSLIYVTVYQAIFSNIKHITSITNFIRVGNFLDPNLFVVVILPSFISVWIAVILYKKSIKAI
jgi:uncharacterized membrane protein YqjE